MTDEDEYFPPPRELRELIPALDAVAALVLGGDVTAVRAAGGPFVDDRTLDASKVLAAFGDSRISFASSNTTCNASCKRVVNAST